MKNQLRKIINDVINEQIDFTVEIPKNKEFGDYSTNVALILAKIKGKNPLDIAKELVSKIDNVIIEKLEIKNGFINIFVKKDYLLNNINNILSKGADYGRSSIGKKEKVNIEFVSANPTGLLHVGTSRCAAYGDNLCRILEFCSYDVTREYYFNDGGAQIDNLGKSLLVRYKDFCGIKEAMPEDGYQGIEIIDLAKELYEKNSNTLKEKPYSFFAEYATKSLISIIKEDLVDFRVAFNVWTSEVDIRKSGAIEKCLKKLREKAIIYDSEGATWLKTTTYGDDKDRVLIKSDGSYTYLVPDIAYHQSKITRGYKQIIDVLGSDHHGYVKRLKASVEALGFDSDKIKIKLIQMVRLLRGAKEVKMSKRTGQSVTMRELMDDVGINAARYFFASRSIDTQMDFDIDLAKKKSNDNPVFYVCYAYARICTILKKSNHTKNIKEYKYLNNEALYPLLESIYEFPEVVENACLKETPHLITNFVYDLANLFHTFYEKYRIITDDDSVNEENINLIKAVKITLENALNLIGVIPPEEM